MPGMFDKAIVNQILQANDIVDVISEHVNLTKKGREMLGLCPFHDDHRPSMYVNAIKQIFKCFACGAGCNVETVDILCKYFGLELVEKMSKKKVR